MSFASSLVEDRWAGPIEGTMTAAEAARRALEGSELTLLALPDGTLTVAPASPDTEPDTDPDDTEPHDIGTLPPRACTRCRCSWNTCTRCWPAW